MATVFKIHPAIGVARVGNSDDFFVGPEHMGEQPNPAGGFKDSQCRVKRQAARFRIFAHHDDGTVEEITKAKADITWKVHLANKKAAFPGRGNSGSSPDLTIDPGPRSANGPNQRQVFDTGKITLSGTTTTVPLGEIRTDTNNHLLVLGGTGSSASPTGNGIGDFWQNTEWFDDVSDGPVTATIKLLSDHSTPAVTGAWVIVAPPKFAPHQDSVITLYDRVTQVMVAAGLVTAPAKTSYTKDIYPILQRARDIRWVINISPASAMTWADPVTDPTLINAIVASLKIPGGGGDDMPQINPPDTGDDSTSFQTDRLTPEQYGHMLRWQSNTNYTNDWSGPPAPQADITPEGMDRAALEPCVGGSFYPGIEAGGLPQTASSSYPGLASQSRPIATASNYAEAFRLDHSVVSAGDITAAMALPWQADFRDCAQNWWPVPRPNEVIRNGVTNQGWTDGIVGTHEDMVQKWSQLGFVLRQGNQHIELERCDSPTILLDTPVLNFQDVPQGPLGAQRQMALAITFEVISPSSAVTLQYAPGGAPSHPQLFAFNSSVTVGPTAPNTIVPARLWIVYKTSNPGDVLPPQIVTVQDSAATQSWNISILGNTVARKTAAVALVMDRSGSMSDDRGDGQSKHDSLQQAASIFVDAMLEGDGVGLVRFNQDAQVLQPIVQLGDGSLTDINRGNTKDTINGSGLDPNGNTSIGDGIFEGRGILSSPPVSFDVNSLVVLTDGMENSPRMIADVADQINEFTYAVGLGQPQNISVPALQQISGNNGGYLLVTGAITTDNRFMLEKYFLQILAGVSNAEIVLDPQGQIFEDRVVRVPFQLTSADSGVDVFLLTPNTKLVDFRLQTPGGRIIEPWQALAEPGMRYVLSDGVTYYRLALPVELQQNRFDGGGTWSALLTIGRPRIQPDHSLQRSDLNILRGLYARPSRRRSRPALGARAQRNNILAAERFDAEVPVMSASASSVEYRTLPYSLVVHAYSNLSLAAHVEQAGFEPGAVINLYASLAQSGIPLAHHAKVWADVTRPDGSVTLLTTKEHDSAQFSGTFTATVPGVYQFRVRAQGTTFRGEPFTREKTLTAAVWRGGNSTGGGSGSTGTDPKTVICDLVNCLLHRDGFINAAGEERLRALGIDLAAARECFEKVCHGR